mgnify:CR=1 FL=1
MATKKKAKSAAKKSAPKAAAVIKPVKERLTKSAILSQIAEKTGLSRAQVGEVLGSLEGLMLGSVHPSGNGEFMFPGLFKVALRKVPARKAGTLIRNPATGETIQIPAKTVVKFRVAKAAKDAILGK